MKRRYSVQSIMKPLVVITVSIHQLKEFETQFCTEVCTESPV